MPASSMTVQAYFERIAHDFDSYYSEPSGWFQRVTNRYLRKPGMLRRLNLALAALNERPQQTILDVGCGSGVLAIPLAQEGHQVVGLDFSAPMIEMARQKAAAAGVSVDWRIGDFLVAELPEVDSSAALGVFEYAAQPEALLERMLKLTRPGGRVMFDLPSLFNIHTPLRIPYLLWRRQRSYFYTHRTVRQLLNKFADRIAKADPRPYGAGDLWVLDLK